MALDPYLPCPCGSGKKFKWCCLPIYDDIDKAMQQFEDGQQEAALRTMEQLVAAHPDNPEAHGRRAMIQFAAGQFEAAEASLDRAFQINPNYPFGYYLRGNFLLAQAEPAAAVMQYRKATDAYDPGATGILAGLYGKIAEIEMRLNRPVACRAALQIAIRLEPTTEGYRSIFEQLFGAQSRLPAAARKEYTLQSPPADAPPERKKAWDEALARQTTGKLGDALRAFEQLTADDPDTAAGWYNLALTSAWLGQNAKALQALDEYVRREPDEEAAAAAWALAEVLRCGDDVPDSEQDYVTYGRMYHIANGPAVGHVLNELHAEGRLILGQVHEQEQVFSAIIAEPPAVVLAGVPSEAPLRYGAHLMIIANVMRVWSASKEKRDKISQELEQRLGDAIRDPTDDRTTTNFSDILVEALVFPLLEEGKEEELRRQIAEGMADYFEDAWLHRPRCALSGVPPIDAAGHATLRKKLRGVVQFLEDCAAAGGYTYDFDRLRRKLGLRQPAAASATAARPDVSAMGAAELAALDADALADEELEQAYQAASRLDAQELSLAFLKKLVARPPHAARPDRFPWYRQLIQNAVRDNDLQAALDYVNEGEKTDCEYNEGRRRDEYELWRGRIHAKRGEIETAQDVFDRLIARAPAELRYRGTAAEAMLSAKDHARALKFAQEGLAQARKQQDRDSEQYFLELTEAAQKK